MKIETKNRLIRSFGRIKGRAISEKKESDLENILPKYSVKIEEDKIKNNFNDNKELWFEVGFGYGEHTTFKAVNNPGVNIIACEAYINGILSLLNKITENNLNNIKIFRGDARELLEKLSNDSISKFFVLFPDPWPKKKQNKRRIINSEFLKLVASKMKNGGNFLFASDIENYVEWTIDFASNNKNYIAQFNSIEECKNRPDDWVMTRYAEKAVKEGRKLYFLNFKIKKI